MPSSSGGMSMTRRLKEKESPGKPKKEGRCPGTPGSKVSTGKAGDSPYKAFMAASGCSPIHSFLRLDTCV